MHKCQSDSLCLIRLDHHAIAIPLFVFNVPAIDMVGGPFRPEGKLEPHVVNGSMDAESFLRIFRRIHQAVGGEHRELR